MADTETFVVDITDLGVQEDVVSRVVDVTGDGVTGGPITVPSDNPDTTPGARYEVGPFSGPQDGTVSVRVSNIDDAGLRNPVEEDVTGEFVLNDTEAPVGPSGAPTLRMTGEVQG